jgi:thiol-disulfide isomerase/thioredoxin
MDRLSSVIPVSLGLLVVLGAAACDKSSSDSSGASASRSRVNAVAATHDDTVSAEAFCDLMPKKDKAPALELPALAGDVRLADASGWRWINLWATWCKPCIEEMPRLLTWQKKLAARGLSIDLRFVSADESDETIASFRTAHAGLPESVRLADADGLVPWLESLGVAGATLPVQIFVDENNAIRCIRSSAVSAHELDAVADLLRR